MSIVRLLLALMLSALFAGCATKASTTMGDVSRLSEPNMRIDKILMPAGVDGTVQELYVFQLQYKGSDGKPIMYRDAAGNMTDVIRWHETARSLPFVREFILGASPGAAVAFINGRTARRVAEIGRCPEGSHCGDLTVVSANAENINQNRVQVGVNAGLPCAAAGTCLKGD